MKAPYAADAARSRGRRHPEPAPELRGEYQRDRDRIIHCNAFRRLTYKTQVFVNHEGDLYRTRVTHSLEVAQIGRTLARVLRLDEDLTEAICLAHDLGHTPFGHAGQDALNDCMREFGGFEHNLQSLRVVDELEERYAAFQGLNLMFETREGILKHCSAANARALGDVGERFLKRQQPSLEAQLANLADEIAYNNHDVDDGLRAGLVTLDELGDVPLFARELARVRLQWPGRESGAGAGRRVIHETIRRMINHIVKDVAANTQAQLAAVAPRSIDDVRSAAVPLVGMSEAVTAEHLDLKRFLRERVYKHSRVLRMTTKAQQVLRDLFEAFMREPALLPPDFAEQVQRAEAVQGRGGRARVICDYVAGMTDRYAFLEHRRLFDPEAAS